MQKIFLKVQTQLAKFAYDYNRYIDTLAPQRPKIDNQYLQREFYISPLPIPNQQQLGCSYFSRFPVQ